MSNEDYYCSIAVCPMETVNEHQPEPDLGLLNVVILALAGVLIIEAAWSWLHGKDRP